MAAKNNENLVWKQITSSISHGPHKTLFLKKEHKKSDKYIDSTTNKGWELLV